MDKKENIRNRLKTNMVGEKMTLVLGALSLTKVRTFRTIKSVKYPRMPVIGKSTGTIDPVNYVRDSDEYEIVAELTNSNKNTLMGYLQSIRTLTDTDAGLSENVHVERVECDFIIGRDYTSTRTPECWLCTIGLVLSNS